MLQYRFVQEMEDQGGGIKSGIELAELAEVENQVLSVLGIREQH